jgi:ribosomal protein S18 acetylase RimI-like enzyme
MILFRDATQADFEVTYAIKRSSIKPYVEMIWGWNEEAQLEFHKNDFDPRQITILVDQDQNAVGLLNVTEDGTVLTIKSILICEKAQGGGIGTEVISRLIEQARSTNKRLELQVLKVNGRAKKLYERLGFKTMGETEFHYKMAFT